jgi:quinol monooxygenase YgiN
MEIGPMSDNDEVVVVATMKVMPDRREEVRAALLRQVARVHVEELAAQRFAAHETEDGFVLIEKRDSAESAQEHASGAALAEYRRVLDPALSEPLDIRVLKALPAGDPQKGSL